MTSSTVTMSAKTTVQRGVVASSSNVHRVAAVTRTPKRDFPVREMAQKVTAAVLAGCLIATPVLAYDKGAICASNPTARVCLKNSICDSNPTSPACVKKVADSGEKK